MMDKKMKVRLKVGTKVERFGKDRYTPDCPISRLMCLAKRLTPAKNISPIRMKDVKNILDEGFEIEYTGTRDEELDQIGAVKIDD